MIGARGMLGTMVNAVAPADYEMFHLDLPDFDLTDPIRVSETLSKINPHIIMNCAAYTNVDGCETQEEAAMAVNGSGPGYLAEVAANIGAVLVHISTDYVFSGEKETPYLEEDATCPSSAYGRTKLAGERAIIEGGLVRYFIIRTSWLYGPNGRNFVETILRLAAEKDELRVVSDQIGSPTFTEDLARAIFQLIGKGDKSLPFGVYHFSNQGACSWFKFARAILFEASSLEIPIRAQQVIPITTDQYPMPARRPAYSVLSSEKFWRVTGLKVPSWQDGLHRYMKTRRLRLYNG